MSTETEALAALIALPLVKQERDEMRVRVAEMEKDARRDFAAHMMIVEALKVRASAALSRAEAAERKVIAFQEAERLACAARDAARLKLDAAEARATALEGALRQCVDEDGHVHACGNGGEDPEDCSPLCSEVSALLSSPPPTKESDHG